jgi:hypothetical protein
VDIFESRLALYTKPPWGRCLTYVGREGIAADGAAYAYAYAAFSSVLYVVRGVR